MARFKIVAGVPDFSGTVGEGAPTRFIDGCAELDVTDGTSASRLAYFMSAGYGIEPLDRVDAVDAIRQSTTDAATEARYLEAEIARLERVQSLDKLRAKHAELTAKPDKRESEAETPVSAPVSGNNERPADNAGVGEWRAYAVRHLGVSEERSLSMTKAQIQAEVKKEDVR